MPKAKKPLSIHVQRPELASLWRPISAETLATLPPWKKTPESASGEDERDICSWSSGVIGRVFNWASVLGHAFGQGYVSVESRSVGNWFDEQLKKKMKACLGPSLGSSVVRGRTRRVHAIETGGLILFCYGTERWAVRPLDAKEGAKIEAELEESFRAHGHGALELYRVDEASEKELRDFRLFFEGLAIALAMESDQAMESFSAAAPTLGGWAEMARGKKRAIEEEAVLRRELAKSHKSGESIGCVHLRSHSFCPRPNQTGHARAPV